MTLGQGDSDTGRATPSWGVVMTVNEPAALVVCNVRWHLATGARAVHVFLDDPQDPAAAALERIAGCRVTLCDDAYWAGHRGKRGRPDSQMRRQTINANAALRDLGTDWLFHIDADEFIWQDAPLADELAAGIPAQTEVNLAVLERLFPYDRTQAHLFDGPFRASSALSEADAQTVFGDFAGFMKRGQYSHGAGKSGVRAGDRLRLGVHNATVQQGDTWRRSARHVSTSARLLHFDGITPLHWMLKVLRYRLTPAHVQQAILQPHRAAQIDWMVARADTTGDAMAAHAALFAATPERCAQLARLDLLAEVPFDPAGTLGADTPDLSPAAFDSDLLARNPWARALLAD